MHASPPPTRARARAGSLAFQPPAGSYPTGVRDVVGDWDASAWTGRGVVDPNAGAVAWKLRPFAFLAHAWFWMLAVGIFLVQTAGIIGSDTPDRWWLGMALVGIILVMSGVVMFFQRLFRFHELPHFWVVLACGVAAAGVANAVAVGIEGYLDPAIGSPMLLDLWLSGPVEETAKLLLPFLLLVFSRRLFGDPRAGLLMVLIAGAGFGVWEAMSYLINAASPNMIALTGVVRSTGEILHPLWTCTAAALIWLAAHRAGRVFTLAGLIGWLIPVAMHSLHDGLFAHVSGTHNTTGQTVFTDAEAGAAAVLTTIATLFWAAIAFFVLRPIARELVPPTAVARNPRRWRPRLRQWGIPHHERSRVAIAQSPAAES